MQLLEKIGLSRNYFMEELLVAAEESKCLRYYHTSLLWECYLFKNQKNDNKILPKANEKVYAALEFLSHSIKKDPQLKVSDLSICFLEAFDMVFPKLFNAE